MNIKSLIGIAFFAFIAFSCDSDDGVEAPENDILSVEPSDLQKVWAGEYEGWDSMMNVKMKIQRELSLNPNGTYTNVLGAVIDLPNASKDPAPIEKEAGSYEMAICDSVCTLTFTVTYDSIVDFGTQVMVGHNGKFFHYPDGREYEQAVYVQHMLIMAGDKGAYRFEATDSMMYSLSEENKPVVYYMDVKTGQ